MEDCGEDGLRVESMMNEECIQNMEETEVKMDKIQQVLDLAKEIRGTHKVKMKEIQQMLDSAKDNQGYPFVNLTMQVGVLIFGMRNIEQVAVWNQETAQAVAFVLKSTLDRNAQPWLPQGRGQECKEDEVVEEEDKNTVQHDGSDFKGKISLSDIEVEVAAKDLLKSCLLYTSDAADE